MYGDVKTKKYVCIGAMTEYLKLIELTTCGSYKKVLNLWKNITITFVFVSFMFIQHNKYLSSYLNLNFNFQFLFLMSYESRILLEVYSLKD